MAVTLGMKGDPLGRNILGLPVSVPVIVVVAEVVGIVGGIAVASSVATAGTSLGSSYITTWFCPLAKAKKCLADAKASSRLTSLVLRILLEGSA